MSGHNSRIGRVMDALRKGSEEVGRDPSGSNYQKWERKIKEAGRRGSPWGWVIGIGVIGFLAILVLPALFRGGSSQQGARANSSYSSSSSSTSNGASSSSYSSQPSVSRQAIEDVLDRWDQVHIYADRYLDSSTLSSVLQGAALEQQRSTIQQLRNSNCYWIVYVMESPRITSFNVINSDYVIVEVYKNWDMDLYCNGVKAGDEDGPFIARYSVERLGGQWYITHKAIP